MPVKLQSQYDSYYSGNFAYPASLWWHCIDPNYININSKPYVQNSNISIISKGINYYTLTNEVRDKWILIYIYGGNLTSSAMISNFKLIFKNKSILTIKEALDNKFIEPLIIISSSNNEQQYVFSNFYNLLTGEKVSGSYPKGYIYLKITNNQALTGCTLNSESSFNTTTDGLGIYELSNETKISLEPLK